ncbi:beta-propeller domain-containing protein [Candidatus Uhrbacteria bacterium]|nr:beta-propeller domain-containing protein [Candidatus Uhrbacteria bacterium]
MDEFRYSRIIRYIPNIPIMKSALTLIIPFFGIAGMSLVVGSVTLAATQPTRALTIGTPQRFTSCSVLKNRIVSARQGSDGFNGNALFKRAIPATTLSAPNMLGRDQAGSAGQGMAESAVTSPVMPGDFSTTNVQVQGVDEADIIKQDGEFVYHLTQNRLAISQAHPPTEATLRSITSFDSNFSAQDLYIEGNRLTVIGNSWESAPTSPEPIPLPGRPVTKNKMMPFWRGQNTTRIEIYDITNRDQIKKLRTLEFDGTISTSRLINGRIYAVMNSFSNWENGELINSTNLVPNYSDSSIGSASHAMLPCGSVTYFDRGPADQFLAIASIPMSGTGEIQRSVILGSSETVYANQDSIYVARQDWNQARPWLVDSLRQTQTSQEKTQIYAFTLSNGAIRFRAKTSVPGHLLNQYSLDEDKNVLRVATTDGQVWNSNKPSTSAVYTLHANNLNQIGSVSGIAPGEQIYSIRFAGDRAYMVTFKKIDPFFVIDLADAAKPRILGKLKIPGYSDYLHPMDANHVIGIGKNAIDAPETSFAWYQGLKLAVFDVTQVEQPKELWKTEIGDRGSDSPALHDPHAFLYDAKRQLLALPVTVTKLSQEQRAQFQGSEYGDVVFQGAFVFRLTLEKGFELLGRVSHTEDQQTYLKSTHWFSDPLHAIDRILLNRETLITASQSQLQFHHLPELSGYKAVIYPEIKQRPDYILY